MISSQSTRALSTFPAVALALIVGCASSVEAQALLQLENPPEVYSLGGFIYKAPTLDGWKQLIRSDESFEIVYAERASVTDDINSKLHVVARVFPIPNPEVIPNSAYLVQLARSQQIEKRKDLLVALSAAAEVPGTHDTWTFTLITPSPLAEEGDTERMLHEDFYVSLAPDKSEYLVLNAKTEDPEYRTQLWFGHLYGSLASIEHSSEAASDSGGGDAGAPAGEASDEAATQGASE
ncbi:MAG: hypothetical protein ACI8TX_001436 [Hyphomicrobiaceae bacterium]|jgi:hypothetical protein